jgi:hypothetical protein
MTSAAVDMMIPNAVIRASAIQRLSDGFGKYRNRISPIRGGVEYNYRMIVVSDAVAEVDRTTHEVRTQDDGADFCRREDYR